MEIELNHLRCLMLDKFISLVTRSETTLGLTPSRLKEQSIHSFINHQSFDRSNSIFAEEPSRLESTIPNCRHQRIESKRKRTFRRATQPSPGRALPWWARTSQSQFNHLPPSLHKDFHPLGPCASTIDLRNLWHPTVYVAAKGLGKCLIDLRFWLWANVVREVVSIVVTPFPAPIFFS